MSRHMFGWSYPPGCSGPPDEPEFCEACGAFNLDNCICPECPTCSSVGDVTCYTEHGLTYSDEQLIGQAKLEEAQRLEFEADQKFAAEMAQFGE